MSTAREVVGKSKGRPASDGAGVKLTRVIGVPGLDQIDPFLLLDEFRSDEPGDYVAGFPDHPHRGFETVTYMLAGRMRHRDNQGNEGLLEAGSIQWMTAGRGIVHSEMPEQQDGLMWGFQLWVNLPAKNKMQAPSYQDIPPCDVPVVEQAGLRVKVLAGEFGGQQGPVTKVAVEPLYLDIQIQAVAGSRVIQVPAGLNAFLYVFEGCLLAGQNEEEIARGELARLGPGEQLQIATSEQARSLLIAGRPIGEPVARHGPFVMNNEAELRQAFMDFQAGRF
ncbi:MAG: pirin family protein [Gammaproteobacteria bacterium]|nr:pirin family protein [Gammaproteobacteria bacterium]